jgi:stage II sporulation protein M
MDMPRSGSMLRDYMKEHLWLYIFVAVLFLTGAVFGAVMVGALTLDQKQEMARHLGSFLQSVGDNRDPGGLVSFQQALSGNVRWVLLIWILGLSVIGLPLIFILNFLKGVLVGFTAGYLAGQYAWKGVLFALVSVAPQNLLIVPAIVISSVTAMAFSLYMIKNRFLRSGGSLYRPFMRFSAVTLAMAVVLAGASFYESSLSVKVMDWVAPMLAVSQ